MSKKTASRSVSSFADLPELIAETIATDAFEASFGDPIPLSIIEPGEEPGDYDMPDPRAAQAECGGMIASIFDLCTDTRLEPFAQKIAWGMVNSVHYAVTDVQRREDAIADEVRELARRIEPGEVFNKELEDRQLQCQSLIEQRAALEAMRDYAAAVYHAYTGRAWTPARGSRASITTASQISALDFLRARAEKRRDRHDPEGPIVVVSGPADWHDWRLIWDRLDLILERIPNLVIVTTGQRTGVDAIASAWAEARRRPCINWGLYGRGNGRAFKRNREINDKLMPVEAVLCEGSGIQSNLYELFNPSEGRRVPTHVFMRRDQQPLPPIQPARRLTHDASRRNGGSLLRRMRIW